MGSYRATRLSIAAAGQRRFSAPTLCGAFAVRAYHHGIATVGEMTMRVSASCLLTGMLMCVAAAAGRAAVPDTGDVAGQLPTGPEWVIANRCVSMADATTLAQRSAGPVPSQDMGSPLEVALRKVPQDLRPRVELCPWGQGWFITPAGWHEQHASLGTDGTSSWTFVAPGGEEHGWFSIGVVPACVSCMLGDAEGYFPAAIRLYNDEYHNGPSAITLVPVQHKLSHPDLCTALLAYRSDGLEVQGQLYFSPPIKNNYRSDGLTSIFVAMPPGEERMQTLMLTSFWGSHPPQTRPCPPRPWSPR